MAFHQKILVLSRHGIAPQDPDSGGSLDLIEDESITTLYSSTGGRLQHFVGRSDLTPGDAFLRHSDKGRTRTTGRAILGGAFSCLPIPQTTADLEAHDLEGLDVQEDPRLSYANIDFNLAALKEEGGDAYMNNWIKNPDATSYGGVPVTSFNEVLRTRKPGLVDALGNLINGKKSLGVVVGHSPTIEPYAIAAVNSGRDTPITTFEEIGGQFGMEQFGALVLSVNDRSGTVDTRFVRDKKAYKVDLVKLMN